MNLTFHGYNINQYALGVLTLPALLLALYLLSILVSWLRKWFFGLGMTSWLGMCFLIVGLAISRKKHCKVSHHSGRHWFSPNVSMFKDEEATE